MPRPARLSLELLETFVAIVDHEGGATLAAADLGVNQPSASKRLAALRHATGARTGEPWLVRQGKRWRLTSEGKRVWPAVADMVRRYRQLEGFVAGGGESKPAVAIACGQQAAVGFVGAAVERFLTGTPEACVRLSTPRGRARIEGVAAGQFDFAIVTERPDAIRAIARRDMYIEPLFDDHFVLAANPPSRCAWAVRWRHLAAQACAVVSDLLALPFVLPEAGAARREQFDAWWRRSSEQPVNVILESGGWQTILDFIASGVGVGLVPRSAVAIFQRRGRRKVSVLPLDPAEFPPDAVRLSARKAHGKEEPDLTDVARRTAALVREEARQGANASLR